MHLQIATREIAKIKNLQGLNENEKAEKQGGETAKIAKQDLEKKIGKIVITSNNFLNYEYILDNEKTNSK